MKRDTIELNIEGYIEDNLPEEFEFIKSEEVDFDSEKGFCTYEVIIKRLSDNKYFKNTYTRYQSQNNWDSFTWEEVFPKSITITMYE